MNRATGLPVKIPSSMNFRRNATRQLPNPLSDWCGGRVDGDGMCNEAEPFGFAGRGCPAGRNGVGRPLRVDEPYGEWELWFTASPHPGGGYA